MKDRKGFLVAGIVTLLVGLCIIFPLQKKESNFIFDFAYTYLSIITAGLLLMYFFMGKTFFKGLLFLFFSGVMGFCAWLGYLQYAVEGFFSSLIASWIGIPAGLIAGLIFIIINYYLKSSNKYLLIAMRILIYLITLFVVSILFAKGGDWIYELFEYFKPK